MRKQEYTKTFDKRSILTTKYNVQIFVLMTSEDNTVIKNNMIKFPTVHRFLMIEVRVGRHNN